MSGLLGRQPPDDVSHKLSSRQPLLSPRPAVIFYDSERHCHWPARKFIPLVEQRHTFEGLAYNLQRYGSHYTNGWQRVEIHAGKRNSYTCTVSLRLFSD